MTQAVLSAILLVCAVGLVAAVLLVVASIIFAVPVDETAVKVRECLPGANCGACGFSGCDGYAAALAKDKDTAVNLCKPGGADAANAIAEVLGVEAAASTPEAAYVHCAGDCNKRQYKSNYQGIESCAAQKMLFGGASECTYGCLGCGDCVSVCEYDAIHVVDGVAKVDRDKCVACGMCAKQCPNNLITITEKKRYAYVSCSNQDKGAVARKACTNGCIGCKKCENTCKLDAIHVENNLARVDYDKCVGCGLCAKECPVGLIEILIKK